LKRFSSIFLEIKFPRNIPVKAAMQEIIARCENFKAK